MPSQRLCPQCRRTRWIPRHTAPWCTPSCKRAATLGPTAPQVTCCACGKEWDARDLEVRFRSLDSRWQCVDMFACRARENRRRAEAAAAADALGRAMARIATNGWAL